MDRGTWRTWSTSAPRQADSRGRVAASTTSPNSVVAFTDALRQEMLHHQVRVSVIEPGTVDTELTSHLRDGIRQAAQAQTATIEAMRPDDIADTISFIVTRDRRVAINEILVRASAQTW